MEPTNYPHVSRPPAQGFTPPPVASPVPATDHMADAQRGPRRGGNIITAAMTGSPVQVVGADISRKTIILSPGYAASISWANTKGESASGGLQIYFTQSHLKLCVEEWGDLVKREWWATGQNGDTAAVIVSD